MIFISLLYDQMTAAEKFEILRTSDDKTNILSDKKITRDEIIKTGENVDTWKGSKDYEQLWSQHTAEVELFQTQLDVAQNNEKAEKVLIEARKANLQIEASKASVQADIEIINRLTKNTNKDIETSLIQALISIGDISKENLQQIATTLGVDATSLAGVIDTCNNCGTTFDIETIKAVGKLQFFAFDQYMKEVEALYNSGKKYKIDRSAGPATFRTIKTILQENQSILDRAQSTTQPVNNTINTNQPTTVNQPINNAQPANIDQPATNPLDAIILASDVGTNVETAFINSKDAISKAADGVYVEDAVSGVGFKKFGKDVYFSSNGNSDNLRGKIDEPKTNYIILDRVYPENELTQEPLLPTGFMKVKTDTLGWKLIWKGTGKEPEMIDGYYQIGGELYNFDADGNLVKKPEVATQIPDVVVQTPDVVVQTPDVTIDDNLQSYDFQSKLDQGLDPSEQIKNIDELIATNSKMKELIVQMKTIGVDYDAGKREWNNTQGAVVKHAGIITQVCAILRTINGNISRGNKIISEAKNKHRTSTDAVVYIMLAAQNRENIATNELIDPSLQISDADETEIKAVAENVYVTNEIAQEKDQRIINFVDNAVNATDRNAKGVERKDLIINWMNEQIKQAKTPETLIAEALATVEITKAIWINEIRETAEVVYSTDESQDKMTRMVAFINEAIAATDASKTGEERKNLIIDRMVAEGLRKLESSLNDIRERNTAIDKTGYGAALKSKPTLSIVLDADRLRELNDKKEKLVRQKIERTDVKELFATANDPEYFNHLAINLGEVESLESGGYRAKFIILRDAKHSQDTETFIDFDANGSVVSKEIIMPKMFGVSRTYEMKKGVFVEKNQAKREKLIATQKQTINDMIATTGQSTNMLNNAKLAGDADIDGNYTISFDVGAVKLSNGEKLSSIKGQAFQVYFDEAGTIQLTERREYISDESADLSKKWKGVFDIIIDENSAKNAFFNIDVTTTKEKEISEKDLTIKGLDGAVYYNQKPNGSKKGSTIDIISATAGDKYYSLVTLETTDNGANLKSPKMMSISPLGEIEGDNTSRYIENFREKNKALLAGLTSGTYGLDEASINEVIAEYNTPIKAKVYAITDPKTKEIQYYTAEKDEEKITFQKDAEIKSEIYQAKKSLETRFKKIKEIYDKQEAAIQKVQATSFEEKNKDLGLYTLKNGGITTLTGQDENILSEDYDPTLVKYEVKVQYLNKNKEIEDKGVIYFDYTGAYDQDKNAEYYTENNGSNKPVLEGKVGTFEPKENGTIFFRDESKKNKSKESF